MPSKPSAGPVILNNTPSGLVPAIAPLISQLSNEGLFLAPELVAKAVELAREREDESDYPSGREQP
jgi:hypothetical protein